MNLFRDPWYLLAAFAAPGFLLAAGLLARRRRSRLAAAFAQPEMLSRLFDSEVLRTRTRLSLLRVAALFFLLLALAGPQWGVELVPSRVKGTQVVIALDTSTSMLAEDLQPNRLARAKGAMAQLLDGLAGSRVGIIAFAGEAFLQCPLTTDIPAAKSILARLLPGMIRRPGTELGKAIDLAVEMLSKFEGRKALVLLTDGEDHGKHAEESAKMAAAEGVHIFIIGAGTPEGVPIAVKNPDGKVIGYKKDRAGKTVISRLGEESLLRLASASQGAYFRASHSEEEVEAILRRIDALDKTEIEGAAANRYQNRYRFPLTLSLLLLLAALAWPELPRRDFKKAKTPALLAVCMLCSAGVGAATGEVEVWRGNRDYRAGNYGNALKHYQASGPQTDKAVFNAGAALYKMGEEEKAATAYGALVERLDPEPSAPALPADASNSAKATAPKAYYNMGNALFKMKRMEEAAAAYKRCLILDPADEDCRHNLVLSLRPRDEKKKEQEQKDQQKKEDKKDEKEDEKKDQGQPPAPKDRPRPQEFSKEDAERLLKAVREKERAAQKRQPLQQQSSQSESAQVEQDW